MEQYVYGLFGGLLAGLILAPVILVVLRGGIPVYLVNFPKPTCECKCVIQVTEKPTLAEVAVVAHAPESKPKEPAPEAAKVAQAECPNCKTALDESKAVLIDSGDAVYWQVTCPACTEEVRLADKPLNKAA